MTPDFSKLEYELDRLREHGHQLQRDGQTIVRIAESGRANVANYYSAYKITLDTLGDSQKVQNSLNTFMLSGDIATSALHSANESLEGAENDIDVSIFPALSGVTISNVATQSLIAFAIDAAPEEKKEIFVELAKKTLQRSFSSEELDTLLGAFREDLPKRRRGAWDTFDSPSEDALAQAAHSMRDIVGVIIARLGSNERLEASEWFDRSRKPTMSDRVRLLLYGAKDNIQAEGTDFIASQISEYVSEDTTLKAIAHGSQPLSRESLRLGMEKIEELLYLILSRPK